MSDAIFVDSDFNRDTRYLALKSQLGAHALLPTSLIGVEGISEPFQFTVEFLSSDLDIKPEELVGTDVSLRVMPVGPEQRFLHGKIARLAAGPSRLEGVRSYRAEVVPWLSFLSRSEDCRIFQNKRVPEILEIIFRNHNFIDYEINLQGSQYHERVYCVQYRESALQFVSRLMEEEGIFYFFRHEESRHVMVIADANVAFKELDAPHNIPRYAVQEDNGGEVHSWERDWEFRSGRWAQRDFNFERPSDRLQADVRTLLKLPGIDRFERFAYPGGYDDTGRGGKLTRLLMEAEEAAHHIVRGHGSSASFRAGGRFKLADHPIPGEADDPHILRRVWHEVREPTYLTARETAYYRNRFECFPKDLPFRPERLTRRPIVQGPQTATVTGPTGSEIFTDKHGRVKLRFHWDRNPDSNADEMSSCWVRVSQVWAGAGYGAIQIPRIGQEVIVDFLEGDPDRPIITGRVYNAEQMPPHGLPAAAVKSGIKSNSTKGGGGSNELTFDDTKGQEKVYLHAQYDMDSVVEHDETQHVINNRKINVDGTHTETIAKDTTITVSEGNYVHQVATGTASITVKGKVTETFQDAQDTTVTSGITITSSTSFVHINAATDIILQVGASRLALYKDGRIELQGKAVAITGSDAVNIAGMSIKQAAGNDHNISGQLVISEGAVSNTVKGAMVMLNP